MVTAVAASSIIRPCRRRQKTAEKTPGRRFRCRQQLQEAVAQVVFERVPFESVEVALNPFVERGVRGLRSGVPVVLHPRSEESRGEAARGPRIGLILRPL